MPKKIITLDSSQIKEFKTCEHSWALSHIENLRKSGIRKDAMEKGTIVHFLLETFYTLRALDPKADRHLHYQGAVDLMLKSKLCENAFKNEWKEIESFIKKRFFDYIIHWTAYDFIPLKKNGVPAVELGFSVKLFETADWIGILEGKMDMLSTLPSGKICFVDHKTRGNEYWKLYPYKLQFKNYALACGLNWGMYNYFPTGKTADKTDSFSRKLVHFSDEMLSEHKDWLKTVYESIYAKQMWFGLDRCKLESQDFPKNFSACSGPFETNPCQFAMICENPENQRKLIKQTYYEVVKPWSPWS